MTSPISFLFPLLPSAWRERGGSSGLGPLETECRERRVTLGMLGASAGRFWALEALEVGVRDGELGGSESELDEAMAACPLP